MDFGAADLSLEGITQKFTECSFSLNVTLPLTSAVPLTPLQILISPRNGSTKELVIASLKPPLIPKAQYEQFQAEQHTKDVLIGMPFTLQSAQTSFHPASY